jgi:hypothetical protein
MKEQDTDIIGTARESTAHNHGGSWLYVVALNLEII